MIKERQESDHLHSIFHSSNQGILLVTITGFIIRTNPACDSIFGYEQGELEHKKIETLIPKHFELKQQTNWSEYLNNINIRQMEQDRDLWGVKKDGSQLPVEISLSPAKLKERQIVVVFVTDISEKKKMEKELKESKDQLLICVQELEKKVRERTKELSSTVDQFLTNNLNIKDHIYETEEAQIRAVSSKLLLSNIAQNFPRGIVAVVDLNFKIVFIKGEELDDIGLKGAAYEGMSIDEIEVFSDKRKKRLKNYVRKTINGEHISFEIYYKKRPYLVHTTPLYNNTNKITQALLVFSNISRQKQTELEILSILKKEKELSELKSRFISMASHEFRTPLSSILSSAVLIEKQNKPGSEEKRISYISKIKSNVKNLVVILNDFLSLSKLEEGKVVVQLELFDIIDFSKSLIEEIEEVKKDGQVILFENDQPKLMVFLDQKLLRHIIFNLLSNAIKYSDENTKITYKIKVDNSRLIISVKDEGIGIPLEDQENMFLRFHRAHNSLNIQGTGLGLNIAKQYTELMEGSIYFTSELNIGSIFYVVFSLNNAKDEKSISH